MMELGTGHATSTAASHEYFTRWVDHASWPQWSPDTDWVRVQAPVRTGAQGLLKPKGGPKVKFVISTCEPDREYTDTTLLPGARLVFQHTASQTAAGTDLRVLVTISGPLARLWTLILGKGFRESAQADLDRLVHLVETGA